jgi:hypothetical protein
LDATVEETLGTIIIQQLTRNQLQCIPSVVSNISLAYDAIVMLMVGFLGLVKAPVDESSEADKKSKKRGITFDETSTRAESEKSDASSELDPEAGQMIASCH